MRVAEMAGEPFRYHVESHSEPGMAHTVDLAQMGGLGSCTCPNYEYRVYQVQRKGRYIEWRPGRKGCSECRHIWAARRHFLEKRVFPLVASFENGTPADLKPPLRQFFAWKKNAETAK